MTRAEKEETREAKAEMGGLCKESCEEVRRGGSLEEEDRRQRRVEKTSRRGGEKVAGITSPLTKGKRGRERINNDKDGLLSNNKLKKFTCCGVQHAWF